MGNQLSDEADDYSADSAYGTNSDVTSISSSLYPGYFENGRWYQTKREGEYWGPADEQQFLSMEAAHRVYMLLECNAKNRLFLSPIQEDRPQHILDVGTGSGDWSVEVAEEFPSASVHGIDLFLPPATWGPTNCKFEVDDVLEPWHYEHKFDLVHFRELYGSFTDEQWTSVYKEAYDSLAPGGWIEQNEPDVVGYSDDGTLPADSLIGNWGEMFYPIMSKLGKPLDTVHHMKSRIAAAGFTNIQEKTYKVPLGGWAKNPILKEAGRQCKTQVMEGMEGYVMFTLTHFGKPKPWSAEEVRAFLDKVKTEIETPGLHAYYVKKRVWAQKPFDDAPDTELKGQT